MPIQKKRTQEKVENFRRKAYSLEQEGNSYQEVADILEVEYNFVRTKQWVHNAILWAKASQFDALSTTPSLTKEKE